MTGIPWDVWVDSVKVDIVVAEGWYEARALAMAKLNLPKERIRVSQRKTGVDTGGRPK